LQNRPPEYTNALQIALCRSCEQLHLSLVGKQPSNRWIKPPVDIHAFYPQGAHRDTRVPSPAYPQGYHASNPLICFAFMALSTENHGTIYSHCIYLLIKLISYYLFMVLLPCGEIDLGQLFL
jgi:hypothetical protein|tara:strand:- start:76 stop:441 length:366 start_codon:yes stop_codon:yes gene_type:complete